MLGIVRKRLSESSNLTRSYDWLQERLWLASSWPRYLGRRLFCVPQKVQSMLIIRVSGIGDIILTTPVVKKLRGRYPDAKITYLTLKAMRPILEFNPCIDYLLTEDDEDKIIKQNYDWVINLQLFDNSTFVKDIIQRLKYKRISGSIVDKNGRYYEATNYRYYFSNWMESLMRGAIGIPFSAADTEKVEIYIPENRRNRQRDLCTKFGIGDGTFVGLNLGSQDKTFWYRDHSLDYLEKLIRHLYTKYNIILVGQSKNLSPDEHNQLTKLNKVFPKIINLVDKLTLEELLLVIEKCSVFISSDSGPAHISMAVKTPAILLFGADSGKRIISPRKRGEIYSIINSDCECSPCKPWRAKQACIANKRAQCMETIPVERILNEIEYFLKKAVKQ